MFAQLIQRFLHPYLSLLVLPVKKSYYTTRKLSYTGGGTVQMAVIELFPMPAQLSMDGSFPSKETTAT